MKRLRDRLSSGDPFEDARAPGTGELRIDGTGLADLPIGSLPGEAAAMGRHPTPAHELTDELLDRLADLQHAAETERQAIARRHDKLVGAVRSATAVQADAWAAHQATVVETIRRVQSAAAVIGPAAGTVGGLVDALHERVDRLPNRVEAKVDAANERLVSRVNALADEHERVQDRLAQLESKIDLLLALVQPVVDESRGQRPADEAD